MSGRVSSGCRFLKISRREVTPGLIRQKYGERDRVRKKERLSCFCELIEGYCDNQFARGGELLLADGESCERQNYPLNSLSWVVVASLIISPTV